MRVGHWQGWLWPGQGVSWCVNTARKAGQAVSSADPGTQRKVMQGPRKHLPAWSTGWELCLFRNICPEASWGTEGQVRGTHR